MIDELSFELGYTLFIAAQKSIFFRYELSKGNKDYLFQQKSVVI